MEIGPRIGTRIPSDPFDPPLKYINLCSTNVIFRLEMNLKRSGVCTDDKMSAAVLSGTVLVLHHVAFRTHNACDHVVISLSREHQFNTFDFSLNYTKLATFAIKFSLNNFL